MNQKHIIIIAAIGIALLAGGIWWYQSAEPAAEVVVQPSVAAIDVVDDFMYEWLVAREQSENGSANPELANSPALTATFQEKLQTALANPTPEGLDPVLCQTVLPGNFRANVAAESETNVQVYVVAAGNTLPGQALVNLIIEDGVWKISDISCSSGETPPPMGEYSFENAGQLLKTVPPPLDRNFWYLVYESEGVFGYTAKLFFDSESLCTDREGVESVCDPATFVETSKAYVGGDISEAGVAVKRVVFE